MSLRLGKSASTANVSLQSSISVWVACIPVKYMAACRQRHVPFLNRPPLIRNALCLENFTLQHFLRHAVPYVPKNVLDIWWEVIR
jgi:hypothetical protein